MLAKKCLLSYYGDVQQNNSELSEAIDSDGSTDSFKAGTQYKKGKSKIILTKDDLLIRVENEFERYDKNHERANTFWKNNHVHYPYIAKFSRLVMTPPAKICPFESVFSAASNSIRLWKNIVVSIHFQSLYQLLKVY